MREDVDSLQISMQLIVTHWVMVLDHFSRVGRLDWFHRLKKKISSFLENNHRMFHYFKITYIYHLCFSFAGWELGCSCWEMDSWWYTANFIDGCWEKTWYCSIFFLKSWIVLFVITLIFYVAGKFKPVIKKAMVELEGEVF